MEAIIRVKIIGLTSESSVVKVEKALNNYEGIITAGVNLDKEEAIIRYNSQLFNYDDVVRITRSLGYSLIEIENSKIKEQEKLSKIHKKDNENLKLDLTICILLSFPLILGIFLAFMGIYNNFVAFLISPIFQLVLATPVQFYSGRRIYYNAYKGIRSGTLNMDLLIVTGTLSAYGLSVYNIFFNEDMKIFMGIYDIYFEVSVLIISLFLLGKYLEKYSLEKSLTPLKDLLNFGTDFVKVEKDSNIFNVAIENISVGDKIIVNRGEKIPLDGKVIWGNSSVDESLFSGEKEIINKGPSDVVIGGTTNKTSRLKIEVTKSVENIKLMKVINSIKDTKITKIPIQKNVDKISSVFVPIAIIFAIMTFISFTLITGDIREGVINAISVLIIACPCALSLSTSTSIFVGTSKASENKIIIKDVESLENITKAKAIIINKTGIITKGKYNITDILSLGKMTKKEILNISFIAEKKSKHPIGKAIYNYGLKISENIKSPEEFKQMPKKGVFAKIDNKKVYLGTKDLMKENNVNMSKWSKEIKSLEKSGKTLVFVLIDDNLEGIIALVDNIKESSKNAIKKLLSMNKKVYILTGESIDVASFIGKKLDIKNIIGEVCDREKEVQKLKEKYNNIILVGEENKDIDGMKISDTSVAMGIDNYKAVEASNIILLNKNLDDLIKIIELSEKIIKKANQNLFFAFMYNIIGVILASIGLLNPIIAAFIMAFSSLSIIINSLTLKRLIL